MAILKFAKQNLKNIGAYVFFVFICAFFLLEPQKAAEGTYKSLILWATGVLPVMLPFLIVTDLLLACTDTNTNNRRKALTALYFTSLICACPASTARITEMFSQGRISRGGATRLCILCSNMNPVFMYVTIGSIMFKSGGFGIKLICVNYAACLITYVWFCIFAKKEEVVLTEQCGKYQRREKGCVKKAVNLCLNIGGYMAFFGCLTAAAEGLLQRTSPLARALAFGIAEVTKGLSELCLIPYLGVREAFILCCALCGFSGICITMQCTSYLTASGLDPAYFFLGKLSTAVISAAVSLLFVIN